jgi:proteasome alpha subunit
MGGSSEVVGGYLSERYADEMALHAALTLAVDGLGRDGGTGESRSLGSAQLEVAVLERSRPRRSFRRIKSGEIDQLLGNDA